MEKHYPKFPGTSRKSGIGTVEVVILIAVLVGIALVFREQLTEYAHKIMEAIFNDDLVIDSLA